MPRSKDDEFRNAVGDYIVDIEGQQFIIESSRRDDLGYKFRMLRIYADMNRKEFAKWLNIPYRTMTEWERGNRHMPDYLFDLVAYKVINEKERGRI